MTYGIGVATVGRALLHALTASFRLRPEVEMIDERHLSLAGDLAAAFHKRREAHVGVFTEAVAQIFSPEGRRRHEHNTDFSLGQTGDQAPEVISELLDGETRLLLACIDPTIIGPVHHRQEIGPLRNDLSR